MENQETIAGGNIPEPEQFGWRVWLKILGLGTACSAAGDAWAEYAQLVHRTSHVAESVPPLSAVASLVILLVLARLLGARPGRPRVSQNEILCTYAFICLAVTVGFIGLYRQVIALLTGFIYGDPGDTTIQAVRPYLPRWLVPREDSLIHMLWEGSKGAPVEWSMWLTPLLCLGGIFALFYFTSACLIGLFHRRWPRDERLGFPVAQLALELVGQREEHGLFKLMRHQWFAIGALLALAFNLYWIVPVLVGWDIPPVQYDFNALWPKPPWDAGRPGPYFRLNPVVFGLGFLVPIDVLLTIWVMVIVMKMEAVIAAVFGVPSGWAGPLFLINRQQGIGAYIAIGLIMAWTGRRYVLAAIGSITTRGNIPAGAPGKWTLLGFLGGTGGLLLILWKAGMVIWFAAIFLGFILLRVLVMARVRAQAGIPNIYLHVFETRSMLWLLGGATLASAGHQSVAALIFMSFLINCTYITPYLSDGFRISEESGFGHGRWILLAVLAIVIGFCLATVTQLTAMYHHGLGSLGHRPTPWQGAYILAQAKQASPAEPARLIIASVGFLTTIVFAVLQRAAYWFPFNPLGFVVACAIGDYVCGPVFLAWLLKKMVLKYGGGQGYRAARVMCLGIVFTHLAVAALWGVLGAFDLEPTQRYAIGFW